MSGSVTDPSGGTPWAVPPILEFDPDPTAIIEPHWSGSSGRSERIAGRVVLCFFQDVIETAVRELGGRPDRTAVVRDRAQPDLVGGRGRRAGRRRASWCGRPVGGRVHGGARPARRTGVRGVRRCGCAGAGAGGRSRDRSHDGGPRRGDLVSLPAAIPDRRPQPGGPGSDPRGSDGTRRAVRAGRHVDHGRAVPGDARAGREARRRRGASPWRWRLRRCSRSRRSGESRWARCSMPAMTCPVRPGTAGAGTRTAQRAGCSSSWPWRRSSESR